MINFSQKLFDTFEGQANFDSYLVGLDTDQDGNYTIFGACGELIRDLLKKTIDNQTLLIQLIEFIDEILTSNDSEWENVIKSEIISILDNAELKQLKSLLSDKSKPFVEFYLR